MIAFARPILPIDTAPAEALPPEAIEAVAAFLVGVVAQAQTEPDRDARLAGDGKEGQP